VRAIALALLLLCFATEASADTAAQRAQKAAAAQKQLSDTRTQIKALADEQHRLESERDEAAKALREADSKVSGSQRSLHDTDQQIAEQEQALEKLQQQKLALENTLSRQRAELAALVRSAYAIGQHEQLKLLLEQDRISDLARVLAYHRYFQRDREKRISGLNVELQTLAQVGEQIDAKKQALLDARDQQKNDLAALAAQRRERGQLVNSLDSRYRDRSARLNALGRDEKSTVALLEHLRKLMAQLPKPAPPPRKPGVRPAAPTPVDAAIPIGPLNLPLAGTVLAGYGGTMPDGHRSQGLLIAGTAGAQVHAVTAGRVAYADWLKGYGLLMILDHGNGWMTLYAFNDALLKNTGDSVRAGEAISTVGSSGGQGRAALYFELRHNGQPEDPRSWLRR
jgi:septal ring factor EnvC (AmiA/AmiB activator)